MISKIEQEKLSLEKALADSNKKINKLEDNQTSKVTLMKKQLELLKAILKPMQQSFFEKHRQIMLTDTEKIIRGK